MADRNSAWLREVLLDEIEAVRRGESDAPRAKSVALLARGVLKSVEVEMVFRQQQSELTGAEYEKLGALPLCESALPIPPIPAHAESPTEEIGKPLPEAAAENRVSHEITEINGFKVGDQVFLPNGKHGTIKAMRSSGRIEVTEDGGGTFPYIARHLSPASTAPHAATPIKSPIVPQGPVPRAVLGRAQSGSR